VREYSASCIDIVPALTAVQQREIGPGEAALGPADQEFHSWPDFVREKWDLGSCTYLVMDTGQIPGAMPGTCPGAVLAESAMVAAWVVSLP
jgi:hypothetical protein